MTFDTNSNSIAEIVINDAAFKYRPNPDWAKLPLFDRKGWNRLPFGAFADSINERVDPANAADEIYVGLDDLDPGCLHIRRWGTGSDVIGTKLRFRKGDIIFGRRRAYQRKLAVAEMDGICSAHAMVVRARPDMVLPEFLPFLMMSDRFMNRAVEISVGSLSPTINWTTLKLEEFDLPPIDQQRRIAEVLWAVDKVEQSKRKLVSSIVSARDGWLEEVLTSRGTRRIRIDELGQVITGTTPKTTDQSNYNPPECCFVSPADITGNRYVTNTEKRISQSGLATGRPIPRDAVMVVCIGSTIGKVGMAYECCLTNQQINSVVCKSEHNPLVVYHVLHSHQQLFRQVASCTAVPILNKGNFSALMIPFPKNSDEQVIAARLLEFERAEHDAEASVASIIKLKLTFTEVLL
jgi:type I restriction enzyme, S subunit